MAAEARRTPRVSLPDADCVATAAACQVREAPEYYIPDLLSDRNYSPDPALNEAAEAHTEEQREAMALLDDAGNLLAVLLASQEQECDSRAMQADAVLKVVRKKLNKAHNRIPGTEHQCEDRDSCDDAGYGERST